jgi:hypothetical protein
MNGLPGQDTTEDCGCCEGVGQQTPVEIFNRPGLTQIAYRVGTHSQFKASMIAALSSPDFSAIGPLTTRDDSDFSIALLDAWAVSADILTFYQERLANESYLRTAGQQRSVFELARLVGYQPSPGVAASASIAFTLNDAPGAPDPVTIPAGTRVQSIPAPGQSAATFETSADLVARVEHNALQPQSAIPADFSQVTTSLWFSGTSTNLKPGDAILFVAEDRFGEPTKSSWALRTVTAVTPDALDKRTLVLWGRSLQPQGSALRRRMKVSEFEMISRIGSDMQMESPGFSWAPTVLPPPFTASSKVHAYALRRKASLFGANAPDPKLAPAAYFSPGSPPADWNWATDGSVFFLDAAYSGIVATTSAAKAENLDPTQYSWAVLANGGSEQLYRIDAVGETAPLRYMLSNKATKLSLDSSQDLSTTYIPATRAVIAFAQSEVLDIPDQPVLAAADAYSYQDGMIAPVVGSALMLLGGARLIANQAVAVVGKRLRLQLASGSATFVTSATSGAQATIAPAVGDIFLVDAFPPTSSSLEWSVLTTKGVPGTLSADATAQIVLLPADTSDPVASEIAVVNQVEPGGTSTSLTFDAPLGRIYDRTTVSVNANVAAATHGETVNELLGGADSSTPNQSFALKQSPLTYVSVPQGQGAASTLQVWVNELQWHETPSFLEAGLSDRVFVTRRGDGGAVTVQFGDGVNGARPPTSQINIRAQYRKGIGLSGMVATGQISQAIDRPGGLKAAFNPAPASGGADPDGADDARNSVPIHVQTMDRVVSLEDYENFARAFAGVAKASASWAWFGRTRGVAVTVAGAGGSILDPNGATISNLTSALVGAGSSYVPLRVMPHQQLLFSVGGLVRIDSDDYATDNVLADLRSALSQTFGFAARNLGQGVAQSEIVATIQQIPGVIAVNLTRLQSSQTTWRLRLVEVLPEFLSAGAPPDGRAAATPATLLLIDPSSLDSLGVWS